MAIEVVHHKVDTYDLRSQLREFELRYGHPSHRMHLAFTDEAGAFHETPDWRRWDFLYTVYRRTLPAFA